MTTAQARDLEVRTHLRPEQVAEVLTLLDAAEEADDTYPLSEHVLLHVRHGGDADVRHLLLRIDGVLAGYAHVDVTDAVAGSSAELAVHPDYRRRGFGRALIERAVAVSPDGRLRLWAHGELPGAAELAAALGFTRSRVLWQMRRRIDTAIPDPVIPDGVRFRDFVPGQDEDAWLTVNRRAFADLPDQASWTRADLEVREAEPWFDPAGFLLAERIDDGALLGFHWTKVHGAKGSSAAGGAEGHAHEPIGEVYVLGVDPAAQGMRLGVALTLAGLGYLRSLGLTNAMLYVDESNVRGISLYTGLGFAHWSTDVEFARG